MTLVTRGLANLALSHKVQPKLNKCPEKLLHNILKLDLREIFDAKIYLKILCLK